MRPAVAIVCWLSALLSCGPTNNAKIPSAVVTGAAGVAVAGVYRATTGGCWASCPVGKECDEASGTCVDLPCHGECPAEHRCVEDRCVRGEPDVAKWQSAPPTSSSAPPDPGELCGGPCLPSETCVAETDGGLPECRPRLRRQAPAGPSSLVP